MNILTTQEIVEFANSMRTVTAPKQIQPLERQKRTFHLTKDLIYLFEPMNMDDIGLWKIMLASPMTLMWSFQKLISQAVPRNATSKIALPLHLTTLQKARLRPDAKSHSPARQCRFLLQKHQVSTFPPGIISSRAHLKIFVDIHSVNVTLETT